MVIKHAKVTLLIAIAGEKNFLSQFIVTFTKIRQF